MESNCQSSFQHGPRDLQSHYFGCLKASERDTFLKRLPERNRVQIKEEEHRIARLRAIFETREDIEEGVLLRRHKQSLRRWRESARLKSSLPSWPSSSATTKSSDLELDVEGDDENETPPTDQKRSRIPSSFKIYADESGDDVDVFARMMYFKEVSIVGYLFINYHDTCFN
jgi:hypothetical protein